MSYSSPSAGHELLLSIVERTREVHAGINNLSIRSKRKNIITAGVMIITIIKSSLINLGI
jgi:hypothetical protein